MSWGFFYILVAQAFSAVADNALLFIAISVLKSLSAPDWQVPVLQQSFACAAIIFAPFVGPFADSLPKGRVMLISNLLKMVGCAAILFGLYPIFAYGCVGIGSAMYSPAKYGILSEYFPPEKLVWANGWMEGLTVASIILGAILGGVLSGEATSRFAISHFQDLNLGLAVDAASSFGVFIILAIYLVATLATLKIPKLPIDHKVLKNTPWFLIKDFADSFKRLWLDPLGQVSLAVTTLFWGAGSTLRLVILTWGTLVLALTVERATQLTAIVAVGIAAGATMAGRDVPLNHAVRVLKVGVYMGFTVMATALVSDWRVAIPFLLAIGVMGGYFVIPMNALLQHRGHSLMGAGHSIAVQNFNENIGIMVMLGGYAAMLKMNWSVQTIAVVLGLILVAATGLLMKVHGHDQDHGES